MSHLAQVVMNHVILLLYAHHFGVLLPSLLKVLGHKARWHVQRHHHHTVVLQALSANPNQFFYTKSHMQDQRKSKDKNKNKLKKHTHTQKMMIIIIIYPLTARVVGALQMNSQVSFVFPCSL